MKFLDLKAQYQSIKSDIDRAISSVIDQSSFILGQPVAELERSVAEYCGVRFGVGLNSGTDALLVSLKAFGIGPGDEVITTPFSFFATAESIIMSGARPVFVDIDPVTFNFDPNRIEQAITKKTKAILPVHLFGLPADLEAICAIAEKHDLRVINDAAQAIGAAYREKNVCSFGDASCISFFPSKNLGAYGDGGMLVTNNKRVATFARQWRVHGSSRKYRHEFIGASSRLDTMQAAVLLAKLPHLNDWNAARRAKAELYSALLAESGVTVPVVPAGRTSAVHQYTIRLPKHRDALATYLQDAGIPTMVYYPVPLHLQPALTYLGYTSGSLPQSEQACQEVLSLPIYPELPDSEIRQVCFRITKFTSDNKNQH